jgi:hypothetical protein
MFTIGGYIGVQIAAQNITYNAVPKQYTSQVGVFN